MVAKGDSARLSSRPSSGNGNRYRLVVVVAASGLGVAGVALYAAESYRPWVQAWVPAIAAALLVGALTVLVLDIVVNNAVEDARQRQLEPLRVGADQEMYAIHKKVDRFLVQWQSVIGQLRGDYPEVVGKEKGSTLPFPVPLVARLAADTDDFLTLGWNQPGHDRVLASPFWPEVVEIAGQVKRQSDRIVEWYSQVLDPSVPAAFGQIQEYLLGVVENMPRTGQTGWFGDDGNPHSAHRDFLRAYLTVWPDDDPTLEAERQQTRGMWLAIEEGFREGAREVYAEEPDRSYVDPVLVGLYDAVNPSGEREDCYLKLIMSARAVLDLGCGTGRLLKRAVKLGNSRAFIGVDRSTSMLAEADDASYEASRIIWKWGDMRTVDVGRRFDLITMTGSAFQELLTDDDIRMVLSNVLRHLDPGGRFAFDVHRRGDEPLEHLTPSPSTIRVTTSSGESVDVVHALERTTEPDRVEFTTTYAFAGSLTPAVSRSTLRFIDLDHLRALLEDVGFRIDGWFGDSDRTPFAPSGAEDVVVATYIH
jgi:SAM-dependent methyltransferase